MGDLRQSIVKTIGTGIDSEHAGHCGSVRRINAAKNGMGVGRPDNGHVSLTVKRPVIAEPTITGQQPHIFTPADRLAYFLILHRRISRF